MLVEGNSFLRFAEADFTVLVARPDRLQIKPSARRVLSKASALYLSDAGQGVDESARRRFDAWAREAGLAEQLARRCLHARKSPAARRGSPRSRGLKS